MQIYALDQKGNLVGASLARKKELYFCPECSRSLRLRGGMHRRLHFYHIDPTPSCRQSGKSETHLALQHYFQNLLGAHNCRLEKRFPSIQRIADCHWISHHKVIEIQCSPIDREEVIARMADYRKEGLDVIWVLHDTQFNRQNVTAAEAYLQGHPFLYTNMNQWGEGIFYQQPSVIKGGKRVHLFPRKLTTIQEVESVKPKGLFRRWLRRVQAIRSHGE